jgi:CRISPR system Cascade subunit CasB
MSEHTKTPGAVVLGWWKHVLNADNGAARKARAQLRRASSPAEVLAIEVTHVLNDRLRKANPDWDFSKRRKPERLALIAATVANADGPVTATLASLFGRKTGDNPALSHLRFQRILHAGDDWTLTVRLCRALPIVGRKANLAELGSDLFYWGDPVRSRWCFDYFGAPAPDALELQEAEDPETEDA